MCDTLVARAPATRDGVTLFAKNGDRPPRECQRIVQVRARRNPRRSRLRCQYIEIPEVAETAAFVGAQPWWLWGLEHGVNEHRVAFGNETVFTRESLGASGLIGMDLVRLGLERGRTARWAPGGGRRAPDRVHGARRRHLAGRDGGDHPGARRVSSRASGHAPPDSRPDAA